MPLLLEKQNLKTLKTQIRSADCWKTQYQDCGFESWLFCHLSSNLATEPQLVKGNMYWTFEEFKHISYKKIQKERETQRTESEKTSMGGILS